MGELGYLVEKIVQVFVIMEQPVKDSKDGVED